MKVLTAIFIIIISLKLTAQTNQTVNYSDLDSIHKARVDSMILSQIPYSKEKAYQDIQNQKIQIIRLTPGGESAFSNEEMNLIEQRFGFHFVYDYFEFPRRYLEQVENEYNNIMYLYLDSINEIDSREEIWSELWRMYFERQVYSKRTDKELAKAIHKILRGESKEIKSQILDADMLYRDRKFNDALNDYERIGLLELKPKTEAYLTDSKYRCLLNLQRYSEADSLKK